MKGLKRRPSVGDEAKRGRRMTAYPDVRVGGAE